MTITDSDHVDKTQGQGMAFATGNTHRGPAVDRYLGIDPGLRRTGYGLIVRTANGPKLQEGGVLRSGEGSLATRITEIGRGVRELLAEFQPQAVAIEQVFSHSQFPKTAVLLAHARGAILFAIADHGIPLIHYSARQIKKLLTGSGNASKEQVQDAIRKELGLPNILEPNDVADACAIALCHYHSSRFDVPAGQRIKLPAAIG